MPSAVRNHLHARGDGNDLQRREQDIVRPGVRQMMDAIHAEGKECGAIQHPDGVAPIHAEVQIKEHRSVQAAVARYCEKLGDRGVVIVHLLGGSPTAPKTSPR